MLAEASGSSHDDDARLTINEAAKGAHEAAEQAAEAFAVAVAAHWATT
jgi:hypothetical protein